MQVLRRSRKECNGRRRRAYRVHQEAATTEEMPLLSYRRRSGYRELSQANHDLVPCRCLRIPQGPETQPRGSSGGYFFPAYLRGRSIYRASSLPSISPRTPAAAVCSRGITARTDISSATELSETKLREVVQNSKRRESVEDEIHVVSAAEAPKQESKEIKANAVDDELFGSQGKRLSTGLGDEAEERKLELQPESELTTRRRRLISPFHRRSRRASRVVVMARSGSRVGGTTQLDRQKSEEAMEGSDEGGGAKEMGSSERYFPGRSRPKQ
ncbi:hypothetical protein B296_00022097 [Ensete ventricosum]|uniref:Uncharacterized protein n=1 Tax=Ensete ventricosum TaxID=4639 RepID=A0A427AYQ8_ENSVE|nr:hypothetical protein B296_00022097 [Ensete ventricosum]